MSKPQRAAGWVVLGSVAGLIGAVIGNVLGDAAPFTQGTWITAIACAVGFGVIEVVRLSRTR